MITHPYFTDILMHTDDELAEILRTGIVERKTIHEWPLSCVQQLILDNGTKLIYKSQLPPTVELRFYENASTKLLPDCRTLGKLGKCDIMLLEWIDAPLLSSKICSDMELVKHGKRVIEEIGGINGVLPVYMDIGSTEAWSNVVSDYLETLKKLVSDGKFNSVQPEAVEQLKHWASSDKVLLMITKNPQVTHGDLKADQIFVTEDGYRIIDWQRPVMAPPEIDLVSLLIGQGVDPLRFVDATVVGIFWFLHLCWAIEAQYFLFPDSKWPIFNQWASEAIFHILEQ